MQHEGTGSKEPRCRRPRFWRARPAHLRRPQPAPIGKEVAPAELRYGTALAAFVALLASVVSRTLHSRAPSVPSLIVNPTFNAPWPAPAVHPWWVLLSRCATGHCTVGSFGSVAGYTDSRDLLAPHDLRIQNSSSLLHSPYEIKDTRLTHAANELRVRWAEPEGDEGKANTDGVEGVNLEFSSD